jgi:hypothetical protein
MCIYIWTLTSTRTHISDWANFGIFVKRQYNCLQSPVIPTVPLYAHWLGLKETCDSGTISSVLVNVTKTCLLFQF